MPGSTRKLYYDSIPVNTERDVMDILGYKGRWQTFITAQIFFIMALLSLHSFSMNFLAPNLSHWCTSSLESANTSLQESENAPLLFRDRLCHRYKTLNSTEFNQTHTTHFQIEQCSSWEYDEFSSTLASKWNLICQREWLISFTKSFFMFGILVSDVLFGRLAEKFGRKPVIRLCAVISSILSIMCAFSSSLTYFVILRFLLGIGLGGFYNTAFVLLMEVIIPEMRPCYGLGIQLGWCLGFICLPGIAYIIRDSFWLQIALAVATIAHTIFVYSIPESPRWLLSKERKEEAQDIIASAVKTNHLEVTDLGTTLEQAMSDMKWEEEKQKYKNLLDLLKTPGLRRMTAFLFLIWFVHSFIYYGLSFNTNELMGNYFVNFCLSGTMEVPAYFLSVFILKYPERWRPLAVSMIFGGVVCLVLYLIPTDIPQTILAAAMIGKFCICVSLGILYVFTAEMFPTLVRNIGLGASTGFGSVVAPWSKELGLATHPAVPQFLFGVLSIAGGALVIFLPAAESLGLLDALEEDAEITQ